VKFAKTYSVLTWFAASVTIGGLLGGCPPPTGPGTGTDIDPAVAAFVTTIEIRGDDAFIRQTREALHLLQQKAPDALAKIEAYVGIIEQGQHSGMWAYEEPPRFEVSDVTAYESVTWYAGAIAHDATHSELYHVYEEEHGPSVPYDVWASAEAERVCIAYQVTVMEQIEAPEYEIESLRGADGTHCDVDGDGDCDWDDYNNRNWFRRQ
jgi:hypothetical protein